MIKKMASSGKQMSSEEDESNSEDAFGAESAPAGTSNSVDSSTDRKKRVHLRCEQMRREAIKTGYSDLKDLLPADFAPLGFKMTNASILYRAGDYLKKLQDQHDAQEAEMAKLQSQLVALKIICQNYEQLAVQQDGAHSLNGDQGVSAVKFAMIRRLLDTWFSSFESQVSCDDYVLLTHTLLTWLEQQVDFQAVPEILTSGLTEQNQ